MPEVLEWKILYQFGLLSFLSSVKETHFTDECPTLGKQLSHQMDMIHIILTVVV